MTRYPTWPGQLARRHLSRLIETLEGVIARLRESLARTVGEAVANAFHDLTCRLTGSSPPSRSPPSWDDDRTYSGWDEPDYDDRYREEDIEAKSAHETTTSRWYRALAIGFQTSAWWLAQQVGRYPVLTSTSLGLTAALVSYAAGPVVGVGLAGIGGALLHLLGLTEAVATAPRLSAADRSLKTTRPCLP